MSQVSFYTGQNLDVEQLADGLAGRDVLLAVDATHAAGAVAVPAACTDLCVSSCYKWLLATHGVAPCYLSQRAEAQVRSTAFGWRNLAVWPAQGAVREPDADEKPMPDKMEPGNPAMVAVLYLDYALGRLLDVGIERIAEHNRDLSEQISSGLEPVSDGRSFRRVRGHSGRAIPALRTMTRMGCVRPSPTEGCWCGGSMGGCGFRGICIMTVTMWSGFWRFWVSWYNSEMKTRPLGR